MQCPERAVQHVKAPMDITHDKVPAVEVGRVTDDSGSPPGPVGWGHQGMS